MDFEKRNLPASVRIVLEDESFADEITDIEECTGIYIEKGNREQVLKNLPFCSSVSGWIKLHDNTSSMYARLLNELISSRNMIVIALRNEFRKVFPCGKTVIEKLATGVTIGNNNTDQVILINPEALSKKILLHELVHAWRNITGQTLADVLTDEKETNRIQKTMEKEMERIL